MKTKCLNFQIIAIALTISVLALFSCAPKTYQVANLPRQLPANPMIAVLPYQIIFNGKLPKNLSEEQRAKQDREEKIAFQQSLFSYLSGKLSKEPIRIMQMQQSNAKLTELGFDIYNIEKYQPQELAKALGVDAVIAPAMEKFRYRSDEASFAIDAASAILSAASKGAVGLPYGVSSTNDVKANCALVSAKDGSMLWNVARIGKANWSYPVNNVMDDLHRRMARKTPDFD
jgi:hypothetical protein